MPLHRPRTIPEMPFIKTKCACGFKGRSQYPNHYMCSGCYYKAMAKSGQEKMQKLQERILKLAREVAEAELRAAQWDKKHPPVKP